MKVHEGQPIGTVASLDGSGEFGFLEAGDGHQVYFHRNSFTASQFAEFWPYIVTLALGFGVQVGLYLYLRQLTAAHHHAHGVIAASGTTSTAAMLACCTHYLANVLPLLGAAGVVSLVAQYQIELFWVGLAFNFVGIGYIGYQVYASRKALIGGHAC